MFQLNPNLGHQFIRGLISATKQHNYKVVTFSPKYSFSLKIVSPFGDTSNLRCKTQTLCCKHKVIERGHEHFWSYFSYRTDSRCNLFAGLIKKKVPSVRFTCDYLICLQRARRNCKALWETEHNSQAQICIFSSPQNVSSEEHYWITAGQNTKSWLSGQEPKSTATALWYENTFKKIT